MTEIQQLSQRVRELENRFERIAGMMPKYAISGSLEGHKHVLSNMLGANRIQDADNDTWIDVENAPDEDRIRLTVAGVLQGLFQTRTAFLPANSLYGQTFIGASAPPVAYAARLAVRDFDNESAAMILADLTNTVTVATSQRTGFTFQGAVTVQSPLGSITLTRLQGIYSGPSAILDAPAAGTARITNLDAYRAQLFIERLEAGGAEAVTTAAGLDVNSPSIFDIGGGVPFVQDVRGVRVRNQYNALVINPTAAVQVDAQTGGKSLNVEGTDAPSRHQPNLQLFSTTESFGGGVGVAGIRDATTAPTSTPASGGVLWSEAGHLRWYDSNGASTRISPVQADVAAVNGNNNNLVIGAGSYIRLSGPTAAFTITGIAGGFPGRVIILYNSTAQNMSLTHEDANSTAANRIRTMTGLAEATLGEGAAILVYDGTASRWIHVAQMY